MSQTNFTDDEITRTLEIIKAAIKSLPKRVINNIDATWLLTNIETALRHGGGIEVIFTSAEDEEEQQDALDTRVDDLPFSEENFFPRWSKPDPNDPED